MENRKETGKTQKIDLRIQKTLENIHNAFKEMIFEMDFEKITVKELSERSRINKKTFYSHYSNLDELLMKIQDEMSEKYVNAVSLYKLPDEFDKVNREFFIFMEENGKWFEKITASKNFTYIRQKMIDKVMENTWEKSDFIKLLSPAEKNIFYSYIQSSTLGIYTQWILDGKKIPLDKIVDLSTNLIIKGISNFIK